MLARRDQLERWTHELKDRVPGTPHLTPVARAATAGVQQYFIDLLEERRRHGRDDLVTHLVRSDIDGVPFVSEEVTPTSEVSGLMLVLFLGGVESTAGLTGNLFKLLAENPDQRALLQRDPTLIPAAIEEALRYITPLQLTARTTSREVTLHGVTIPAGGRVVLVTGAANRDERQFPDPDRFDITRGRSRHLGFGEGVHGCLGAPLARLEARIALEEALPVLGDYELAGTPTFYPSSPNMYVWKRLPVTFPHGGTRAVGRRGTTAASRARRGGAAPDDERHPGHLGVRRRGPGRPPSARPPTASSRSRCATSATIRLPPWEPGAHVDLILDSAPTRQYSLCGDPTDRHEYRLGILRDPNGRGGSLYVHDRLSESATWCECAARATTSRLVASPRYLFIAGGIGITPDPADDSRRGGGRRRLATRLRRPAARLDGFPRRALAVRRPRGGPAAGRDGLASARRPCSAPPNRQTLIYCCGPEPLLAAVESHCAGWPPGSLHLERFAPKPQAEPVRKEAFEVVLQRSELTLTVPPERSILSVVEEAGIGVLSSCAEGTCGTCETPVLDGEPDHLDSVLSEVERRATTA